jgi:5-(carboxyamino)imidazole ribonucleotide synthase
MIPSSFKSIEPGATIGILGGGQLGRMIALAGRHMGYRFITLDPTPDSPCGQVADYQIVANYDDLEAAHQLINQCDVITYEFENVDSKLTEVLTNEAYVPQGVDLLFITQHRIREKQAIQQAGGLVAPYVEIRSLSDLSQAVSEVGLPCVVKTVTGGYDGKGQVVIRDINEVEKAWLHLTTFRVGLVVEKFIAFDKELSVIVARNPRGEVKAFPPAENKHIHNILHTSIVPARIDDTIQREAIEIAKRIAESLEVVGLLAVEFFLGQDGKLYVNEVAPRPHNSGHYTMEACKTSQFEQHVRAICNLPLGSTQLMSPVVMVNVLGEHVEPLVAWMLNSNGEADDAGLSIKVHLYGKHEAKEKRKMGHVNLLTSNIDEALKWIQESNIWQNNDPISEDEQ